MLQGCNFLGRIISFTLRYIEIRKHFLKYHSPPRVPAKAFACICVTIFYTLYGSGLQKLLHVYVLPYFTHCMEVACWHTGGGGGDVQQPKNPGP